MLTEIENALHEERRVRGRPQTRITLAKTLRNWRGEVEFRVLVDGDDGACVQKQNQEAEASDGRAGLYMGVAVELYLGAVSAVCESGRGAGEDEGGRDGRG